MGRSGFDAVILTSPNAIFYATGALLLAQLKASPALAARLVDDRLSFGLIREGGDGMLVVSNNDADVIRDQTWAGHVEVYDDTGARPIEKLADLVEQQGLADGLLGVELRYMPAAQMRELEARLPRARFQACDDHLTTIRAVKTPAEIAILQRAGEVTAEAIWQAYQNSRPGDTEKSVADRVGEALINSGADDIYLAVLGAGENSLHAHNKPGERTLRVGDIVRTDYGGKFDGFASDLARMGVVGKPSVEQSDLYKKCRGVQLETMHAMRSGLEARDIYNLCKKCFERVGLALNFPHVGHAFAFGGHDYPMLHLYDRTQLEVDMIFYVEPIFADPRLGLIQIEDLVQVTPSGGKVLTGARDNNSLWIIPA
jgi:Xaa-Pro aminopeptidase